MTAPDIKDYNTILTEMLADLASKGTRITDMNPGSIIRTLLEITAVKFDESHYMAKQIIDLFFVVTTSGDLLKRRVAERGIVAFEGSKSSGNIVAARSTLAPFGQLIPQGTVFETEDRLIQVESTAVATLGQGELSVTVPIRAVNVGAAGNLQTGISLKQVGVAISLIETATVATPGLAGGADAEDDESIRNRYLIVIRSPGTSGNKADYIKWAMEVSGVGAVYPQSLWNGPGTVKVFLLGVDKIPADQSIVNAAQTYIDPNPGQGEGKAPIGATVTCSAATAINIDISVTVALDGSKTLSEVKAAFQGKLVEHLKEIAFSTDPTVRSVRYNYLGSLLLDIQGIIDYSGLLVNTGTANIVVPAGSVAVKGTVIFS